MLQVEKSKNRINEVKTILYYNCSVLPNTLSDESIKSVLCRRRNEGIKKDQTLTQCVYVTHISYTAIIMP